MYLNLGCSCDAVLEVDVPEGDESAGWMLIHRFMNAHVACGYAMPLQEQPATAS